MSEPNNHPATERDLLIEAMRTIDRMSGLLNDLSGAMYRMAGDGEPNAGLAKLLLRRFGDCSGVHVFITADNLGIELPQDLRGEPS